MNNFKKIGEIENNLSQLIDVLAIVKNNNFFLSSMEKDLILQKLREIYLLVLNEDNIQEAITDRGHNEISIPEEREAEIEQTAEERTEEEIQIEEVVQVEVQRVEEIRNEMFEEANEEVEEEYEEKRKEKREEETFQPEMTREEESSAEKTEEITQAEEQGIEEIRAEIEMFEEASEETTEENEDEWEEENEKKLFQPERVWNEEVKAEENEKEEPVYEKVTEIIIEEKNALLFENTENKSDFSDLFDNVPIPEQNKPEEKQEVLENDLFQFLPSEFHLGHKKEPEIKIEKVTNEKAETVEKQEVIPQQENVSEKKSEVIHEEPKQEIKPEKRSLNDLLNEGKEDKTVGSKFQDAKVTDLAKSISLNDKFLYIKELFQNRGKEFSQAIQILNTCSTIEEAFNEMEVMKKHYFWDSTSPAYLSLCDLLRRKFL